MPKLSKRNYLSVSIYILYDKGSVAFRQLLWYSFVLQKEARHMTELLIELYNKFYTPLSMTAQKVEIYDCHHKLIDLLKNRSAS